MFFELVSSEYPSLPQSWHWNCKIGIQIILINNENYK
jgi:hypothetical protein